MTSASPDSISDKAQRFDTPADACPPFRFHIKDDGECESLLEKVVTPKKRGALLALRHLYFSENNPKSLFYLTVEGEKRALYNPANPPAIVTTHGSVEDWTIENRTLENHEFHLHQTHFLVLSQDNFALNGTEPDRTIEGQELIPTAHR